MQLNGAYKIFGGQKGDLSEPPRTPLAYGVEVYSVAAKKQPRSGMDTDQCTSLHLYWSIFHSTALKCKNFPPFIYAEGTVGVLIMGRSKNYYLQDVTQE